MLPFLSSFLSTDCSLFAASWTMCCPEGAATRITAGFAAEIKWKTAVALSGLWGPHRTSVMDHKQPFLTTVVSMCSIYWNMFSEQRGGHPLPLSKSSFSCVKQDAPVFMWCRQTPVLTQCIYQCLIWDVCSLWFEPLRIQLQIAQISALLYTHTHTLLPYLMSYFPAGSPGIVPGHDTCSVRRVYHRITMQPFWEQTSPTPSEGKHKCPCSLLIQPRQNILTRYLLLAWLSGNVSLSPLHLRQKPQPF